MTFTIGQRVTIASGHNKGRTGSISKLEDNQACCWVEGEMYLWYPLEHLEGRRQEAEGRREDTTAGNESEDMNLTSAISLNTSEESKPSALCPLPSAFPKESDKWYTPPKIVNAVVQVLGKIDLDPCADDGRHIPATTHYTAFDDGLTKEWYGKVFMNPPYSCPGKWVAKLQAEVDAGRVVEAIALVPAATDTNWLHPYLAHQPICFWKGRIKFLDANYKEKDTARQSHCLLYWGDNPQKFKEVFEAFGTVKNVKSIDNEQLKIDNEENQPPLTVNCQLSTINSVPMNKLSRSNTIAGTRIIDQHGSIGTVTDNLGFGFVVDWDDDEKYTYNWERDSEAIAQWQIAPESIVNSPQLPPPPTPYSLPMTIQFPQTEALAAQIAELQALHAKYKECETNAETLKQSVVNQAGLMAELGVKQETMVDWGDRLYFLAAGIDIRKVRDELAEVRAKLLLTEQDNKALKYQLENVFTELEQLKQERDKTVSSLQEDILAISAKCEELRKEKNEADTKIGELFTSNGELIASNSGAKALEQEVEGLKSSNKILRQEREQLQQQLNFYKQDTREADSYLSDIQRLEKENTDYQQRYDGIKAQKEQWESDYYKIKSDRDKLTKRIELLERDNQAFLERIQQLETKPEETTQEFKIGDGQDAHPALNESIELADRVQLVDANGNEDFIELGWLEIERVGTVLKVENDLATVVFDPTDKHEAVEVMLSPDCLKLLSKQPDVASRIKAEQFISGIKKASDVEAIAWSDIGAVCQGNIDTLREICLAARTKTQKSLIEKIPKLLADYVKQSQDKAPLDWVGDTVKTKAEAMLEKTPF